MTIAGFYWFKSDPEYGNFFVIPVLMTAVFAYCVAHSFMSVYEAAVDTLLLCYCKDASEIDTSDADGIINDAVDQLDIIDGEQKKRREERGKKAGVLLAKVRGGRGNHSSGDGERKEEEQGFQVVEEQPMKNGPESS